MTKHVSFYTILLDFTTPNYYNEYTLVTVDLVKDWRDKHIHIYNEFGRAYDQKKCMPDCYRLDCRGVSLRWRDPGGSAHHMAESDPHMSGVYWHWVNYHFPQNEN